ncbi:hypothetical protein B0H14DRAFT_3151540 [Mycena olivaceomarginata]|nr:hypothetical protein B0H14DRAFT_3151540 [Mycena olivaceomarginata]
MYACKTWPRVRGVGTGGGNIRTADPSARVHDCAVGRQGAAGRDGTRWGGRGKEETGEDGDGEGREEGTARTVGKGRRNERRRKNAPQAESRTERRTPAVVQWHLNGVASMCRSRIGRGGQGSLRIAKGTGCVKQWHHVLRLGQRRRCRVARLSGSANQTVLEGDETRDLLRLCHVCVLENNQCRGSGKMRQRAAETAEAVIHFAACGGRCGLVTGGFSYSAELWCGTEMEAGR